MAIAGNLKQILRISLLIKQLLSIQKILSGKGYGIIDDIGGVWSLQDYYDTPKDKVDPEMIDWLTGGEAINLDNFNKEKLNQRMEQYKN